MKQRKYRWDTGLRVRVLGLLVFLLTLMALLGAALASTFATLDKVQQQAERTRQKVLLMEQAAGTYNEMTSSLRGFLITGQEQLLEPYSRGKGRMEYILGELTRYAEGDTLQTSRIHHVQDLVRTWDEQVAIPEIVARRANRPDAGNLIAIGAGPNFIDEIRNTTDAFIGTETQRLQQEATYASRATRNVTLVMWIGLGLATLLALAGFLIFARSVTRSTSALAAAAEAIARGERDVFMETVLDGELQEVAEAFSSMSMTLAAQEEELSAQQEELIAQNEELLAQQDELHAKADALEQKDHRLSRLNRMSQAMIGTIDLDELNRLILDEFLDLYGGSAGILLLAEQYTDHLVVQAERWASPDWLGRRLRPSGPLARCMERSEIVEANYPETITRVGIWLAEVPVSQEIYVPVIHSDRVIAVVVIASSEPMYLTEETRALGSAVVRQAAVALTAALGHLEVKKALLALQEQAAQVEELNAQLEEERDKASAQLEIYLSIVSKMRAAAWLTDTGGNLLVVNDTFREFFGDVPSRADMEAVLDRMSQQLPPGASFPSNVRSLVRSRDGVAEGTIQLANGYVLQWSSAPVGRDHDLIGRLFTFQDVTELTKLDRLKSEFVNTVSHELRTPLTSIIGYLSLVMNEQVGTLEPQQKEFLGVVRRNTDRLANLINDLLDVQRIESGRMPLQLKPIQLADVVRHVSETFRVAAEGKGLTFEVSVPPEGLPLISADPDRLTQVASNLVSNAVKYTPQGSIRISVGQGQNSVYFVVEDTGVGISQADQKRIFEKFFRCDNKYAREAGGTGLGLSLVKMMVEEHGGKVKVESQQGKGSRFTVYFPLVLDAPVAG